MDWKEGDPSEKSCNLSPSKEKPKGIKERMGFLLAPRAATSCKGRTPRSFSRTTYLLKRDQTTYIQEKNGKIMYPWGRYGLENVDPWINPAHIPKENKPTELRGQDGNRAALQGSHILDRGDPLYFFPMKTSPIRRRQTTPPLEKDRKRLDPQASYVLERGSPL